MNKIMHVIIALLIIILGVEGYIITYQTKNKIKEDSYLNIEKSADGVKLVNTKKENDKIIQEYEIVLNGKKKTIEILYEVEELSEELKENADQQEIIIRGKVNFQNDDLYTVMTLENDFNIDFINGNFNERNFTIIQGHDKQNYLAIYDMNRGFADMLYIYVYNDNFEIINKDEDILMLFGGQSLYFNCPDNGFDCDYGDMWYEDNLNFCIDDCQMRAKIQNDKMYVLTNIDECESEGILEERVYTINNNKLEYEVINTYHFESAAGSCLG